MVFVFCCKSLSLEGEPWQPFFSFLVIAAIISTNIGWKKASKYWSNCYAKKSWLIHCEPQFQRERSPNKELKLRRGLELGSTVCLMISKLPLKMANNMLMLKIYPNIVVFRLLQFSILNHRAITAICVIFDNGSQHDSWSKIATNSPLHLNWNFEFSNVQFNLTSDKSNLT